MSDDSLYRYGGYAAIGSAVLYVLSLVLSMAGSPGLGTPLYIASSLLFLVAIAVLTRALMPQNQMLAVLAFLLLGATTVWSLFIDLSEPNASLGPLSLMYGAGFLLYGWLQYSGTTFPRNLAIVALATGALTVVASITLFVGASFDIFGLFNLAVAVPYLIWLAWLGRLWLQRRAVAPAMR